MMNGIFDLTETLLDFIGLHHEELLFNDK